MKLTHEDIVDALQCQVALWKHYWDEQEDRNNELMKIINQKNSEIFHLTAALESVARANLNAIAQNALAEWEKK